MTGATWTVRRYTPGDKDGIIALYEAVHGATKAALCRRNWEWEYEHNPLVADTPPIWVAESDGRIVGLHATIPAMLRCGTALHRIAWSTDLMTHPDYRRQGILKALTERMLAELRDEGTSIFLVFPNRYSGPLLRKRGWFDVKPFPAMIKPLRLWPLLRQVRLRTLKKVMAGGWVVLRRAFVAGRTRSVVPVSQDERVRVIESFDTRFTDLFDEAAQAYDFVAVRDAPFLNWRYAGCAYKAYTVLAAEERDKLTGYLVLATEQQVTRRGYIVDFVTRPGPDQQRTITLLLREAIRKLREAHADTIEICTPDGPYQQILQQHGFAVFPGRLFWSYNLVAHADPEHACYDALRDPTRNWLVSRGDADSDIIAG